MGLLPEDLENYIQQHTSAESIVLRELDRQTQADVLMPRMLSGHVQGRFLSFLSKMLSPRFILEIGTFTGYSAICLAEGLTDDGELHTIDINEELEDLVSSYIEKAGLQDKIIQHIGNALDIINTLDVIFDLVFIDADKVNYLNYYKLVLPKVRKGGIIIADNVLWSGKVVEDGKTSKDTRAILDFNDAVQQDESVENVMVSIRDGLLLIRKK